MSSRLIDALVAQLATHLTRRDWGMATAESCTGGLIAAACTARAGSSDWFERGFVTYSNDAKTELLGVSAGLIAGHGAVSEPVVQAMALGALAQAPVQASVAVTGIAGPTGAVPGKPVGTVWVACAWRLPGAEPCVLSRRVQLDGDREAVRAQSVQVALAQLLDALIA